MNAGTESEYDQGHGVGTAEKGVQDEQQKSFVISNSDTIVDPGTVVIHFDDTTSTDAAVVRPGRFERLAPPTQSQILRRLWCLMSSCHQLNRSGRRFVRKACQTRVHGIHAESHFSGYQHCWNSRRMVILIVVIALPGEGK
jgi:hypothetical protein